MTRRPLRDMQHLFKVPWHSTGDKWWRMRGDDYWGCAAIVAWDASSTLISWYKRCDSCPPFYKQARYAHSLCCTGRGWRERIIPARSLWRAGKVNEKPVWGGESWRIKVRATQTVAQPHQQQRRHSLWRIMTACSPGRQSEPSANLGASLLSISATWLEG